MSMSEFPEICFHQVDAVASAVPPTGKGDFTFVIVGACGDVLAVGTPRVALCLQSIARRWLGNGIIVGAAGDRRVLKNVEIRHIQRVVACGGGDAPATDATDTAGAIADTATLSAAAVAIALLISGHWMISEATAFTHMLFERLPSLISGV